MIFLLLLLFSLLFIFYFILRRRIHPVPKPWRDGSRGPVILGIFQVLGGRRREAEREKKYPLFLYMDVFLSYLKEKFYGGEESYDVAHKGYTCRRRWVAGKKSDLPQLSQWSDLWYFQEIQSTRLKTGCRIVGKSWEALAVNAAHLWRCLLVLTPRS